jgi:hypothetical protein
MKELESGVVCFDTTDLDRGNQLLQGAEDVARSGAKVQYSRVGLDEAGP